MVLKSAAHFVSACTSDVFLYLIIGENLKRHIKIL